MHKGSNMKLQNNEGSEIVINQSQWKVPVLGESSI